MLARAKKAFTLLELIVVIVILGILAALAVPNFTDIKDKANKSVAMTNYSSAFRANAAADALNGTTTSTSKTVTVNGADYTVVDVDNDGKAESASAA